MLLRLWCWCLTLGPGLGVSDGTPTTGQPFLQWILSININRPGLEFILPVKCHLLDEDYLWVISWLTPPTVYPGMVKQPPFSIHFHHRPVTWPNKWAIVTLQSNKLMSAMTTSKYVDCGDGQKWLMYLCLSGADLGQVASNFTLQSILSQSGANLWCIDTEYCKEVSSAGYISVLRTRIAQFVCFEYLCMIFIAGYYCIHKSTGQKNVKTSNNHQTGCNQPRHSGQSAPHHTPGHHHLTPHFSNWKHDCHAQRWVVLFNRIFGVIYGPKLLLIASEGNWEKVLRNAGTPMFSD